MEICQLQQDCSQWALTERRSQSNKAHIWRRQLKNWHGLWNFNSKSINNQDLAQQYNINTRWKVLGITHKGFLPQPADGLTRVFAYKIEQLTGRRHWTLQNTGEGRQKRICIRQMRLHDERFTARRNYSPENFEEWLEKHGYHQSDKKPGF